MFFWGQEIIIPSGTPATIIGARSPTQSIAVRIIPLHTMQHGLEALSVLFEKCLSAYF